MESTKQFYDNLITFYELAPVSEHTLALMIKNLKECQKREEKLIVKIQNLEQNDEFFHNQFIFARESANAYRNELKRAEEQLKALSLDLKRFKHIEKVNAGLKKQCREKKHHVAFLLKKIYSLQFEKTNMFYENLENVLLEQYVEKDMLSVKQILNLMKEIRRYMKDE